MGHDPDVTKLGYFLRRYKVDELPQLFNIIRGDMSFIGPRPAMPEQEALYDDFSRRRLLVRPGISGLAQVSGNIHLTWPERWQYDVQYVDGVSLIMDMKIFFRTIMVILVGEKKFLRKPREKK
jgi:lipopolysaccharide/colanic/teichoic acid biosynthesis glycosyltransferase